ncbi:MAG: acyloxyacyl hydrolase [Rhodospirillaceae bacterium]
MRYLVAVLAVVAMVTGGERQAKADPGFALVWITTLAAGGAALAGDYLRGNDPFDLDRIPKDPDYLTFGAGAYNVVPDNERDNDLLGHFRFEYRPAYQFWVIRPFLGAEFTHAGSFYGYFGFMGDIRFGDHWILSPNAAVGYYEEGGARDLGNPVEFRTGLELAYRFDDGLRVGVAYHHMSNADLGDKNPGVETLGLNVSVPIQYFFGN